MPEHPHEDQLHEVQVVPQFEFCCAETAKQTQISEARVFPNMCQRWPWRRVL